MLDTFILGRLPKETSWKTSYSEFVDENAAGEANIYEIPALNGYRPNSRCMDIW